VRIAMSRGRGRPRGKYRSAADSKLLEYLTLLSMKHGIDSEELFSSLVEASKGQPSSCNGLLIECRTQTRDCAVFLITNSCEVIAQFSMSTRILEEGHPLKEFAYAETLMPRRRILSKAKVSNPQIGNLRSGMKGINLKGEVLEVPKPRSVITRFGGFATVANASISDETGSIRLPLWNEQIEMVSVGDLVHVENAHVVTFRGERQLRISRGGELNVIKR
jgi:replication factor A1